MKSKRYLTRHALPKRNALVVALALGMGISGLAYGQATSGTIFGSAPAGDTVQVTSNSGTTRTVSVGADGSYTVSNLPLGVYTVALRENGQTISSRNNVEIKIGGGVAVSFASQQNAQNLSSVQVTANALPSIDVTNVANSTTITASDLQKLPVGRNMTSIALLTPGTTAASPYFGGVTFGGSSAAENAYYVNGFNTGEPYRNLGGFQLPYGAIAQQQTMAGGFSAKYGRSDGGVISQIGKRGNNEWHFGAQLVWEPEYLEAAPKNGLYPKQSLPSAGFIYSPNYAPGALYNYNNNDKGWRDVITAYVGGPLIKDKLFFFLDVEQTKTGGQSVSASTNPVYTHSTSHETKYYGKLDWNINDSNILEATLLKQNEKSGIGAQYDYNYDTRTSGAFRTANNQGTNDATFTILKYTNYISDNATLEILYGKGEFDNPTIYAFPTDVPYISGGSNQNPAYWGPGVDPEVGIINQQPNTSVTAPTSHLATHGLRADFKYVLGNHTLGIGIDNMRYEATGQGVITTGGMPPAAVQGINGAPTDGTIWIYRPATDTHPYRVEYLNYKTATNMSLTQNAYYLQDEWQVTPNVLLSLGLRNDHYTNYNNVGQAFVDEKNQWEPRLGVSWDVFGDASLKIYGNAGRYYLALPQNAAERAATASTYIYQYFTYTGINPDGTPTGLQPDGPMASPDGEFGNPKDPKQVVSQNLKPMYIDQFNVGFDAKLGDSWQYGAKLSYRDLKATIDDECSPGAVANKMSAMGYDPNSFYNSLYVAGYCRLINPGRTSQLAVKNDITGDYVTVPMTFADWGYPQKPKRRYEAVNLYFEHPFDGKWYGRIDYTFTHARGNTTGQVRPDFGQADVSKTEDWDSGALMVGQDGELMNTRKHFIRIRGYYALTPEWTFGAVARIASGTPRECLGYYGTDPLNTDPSISDPTGYNRGGTGNYHWCAGQIVHPGSDSPYAGHTPWTHQIDLNVRWAPAFADHNLAFQVQIFNALNEQKSVQSMPSIVSSQGVVNNLYRYPVSREAPRYVQLSVSYDY